MPLLSSWPLAPSTHSFTDATGQRGLQSVLLDPVPLDACGVSTCLKIWYQNPLSASSRKTPQGPN